MKVIRITADNFKKEVLMAKEPVLIDFWASWCGPCRMLSPIVDQVAEEMEGVKVGKINVDEEESLAMKYNIMTIPTLLVFKNGEVVNKSIGVVPKQNILDMLK